MLSTHYIAPLNNYPETGYKKKKVKKKQPIIKYGFYTYFICFVLCLLAIFFIWLYLADGFMTRKIIATIFLLPFTVIYGLISLEEIKKRKKRKERAS